MRWLMKILGLDVEEKPSAPAQSAAEFGSQRTYEFIANLSMNTPLKYLEVDGKRVIGRKPKSKAAEQSYGIWIEIGPKDRQMEASIKETSERRQILMGFRRIVESKLKPPERLKSLQEFVAGNAEFSRIGEEIDNWLDGYAGFWDVFNIGCLSTGDSRRLYEAGFENRQALKRAPDDAILKVKGIGAKKLAGIREALKSHTFTMAITVSDHDTVSMPKRQVKSHRADRDPLRCREINLQSLPYVPLPRAPHRWEETREGHTPKPIAVASKWFEIRDADGWELLSVEKIPLDERPDPAFRRIYPMDTGLIMVDDLGNSETSGSAPAAAVRFGREGNRIADASLYHDIYRIGVNALGRGLIAISRDCVAHAYDDSLINILETSLRDSPEIRALQQRLEIGVPELKNHLRCISMAYDNSRYLFTGVDEAWCVDMEGRGLWGVKLPIKEGWSRVTEPSNTFGTSADVMRALEVMNLALPFTAEDLKQSYRTLAKQWHPDLNPGNPNAEEQMKALTGAAELLTGIDSRVIPSYASAKFMKELSRQDFSAGNKKLTITMEMRVGEVQAADWIYATNFSGRTHDVFLAGYSGKIVQVNGEGQPVRAYDIGAVPRQIIDTGDYLYLLTDTRLYILRGDSLVALMDTLESGELLVAQTGFGLLQRKCFQWFREDGTHHGTIATKNPIRRVYYTPQGMVVETRQRRAFIGGVTTWWE